jgi:hypothetical protein
MERLIGLENEYAFNATGPRGGAVDRVQALHELNAIARAELTSLPSVTGNGIFLGNGGRLYLDTGAHQEWCTPESINPWDAVRYLAAGEEILLELAQKLVQRRKLGSATFYKTNVDYSGTGSTWGAHENYMHRADPAKLPDDLIPFLVSRVIITGSGGFDPTTPLGCRFTLSPRAFHITAKVTGDSTGGRGIYHTKDEPLCSGGHHRLHVLVGESLCSHTGNWLKFATTALVVAMAEARLRPGKDVALSRPVEALREYASDPTCTVTAATVGGGRISALEIQQHYLDLARRHATADFMPAWTPRAIEAWSAMLARLQGAPDSVATCLDWAIKHRVYGSRIQKRGFTRDSLRRWSNLAILLDVCAELTPQGLPEAGLTAAYVQNSQSPLKDIIGELTPHLAARGMCWDQLDNFLKLRLELFEIDTRFGELGPGGIFNSLDSAGVLQHRFPGVDNIAHALTNPPQIGRAKVRGQTIQSLHNSGQHYCCDWGIIFDSEKDLSMDLRDPWTTQASWSANTTSIPACDEESF